MHPAPSNTKRGRLPEGLPASLSGSGGLMGSGGEGSLPCCCRPREFSLGSLSRRLQLAAERLWGVPHATPETTRLSERLDPAWGERQYTTGGNAI